MILGMKTEPSKTGLSTASKDLDRLTLYPQFTKDMNIAGNLLRLSSMFTKRENIR